MVRNIAECNIYSQFAPFTSHPYAF